MSIEESGQGSARTLKRRLMSGSAWTAGARIVAGLSGFAVNALLSRLISPEDLGAYFLLVSIASVGAMMAQLGLQLAVVRLIADAIARGSAGQVRGFVRTAFTAVAISTSALAFLLVLAGGDGAVAVFHSAILAQVMWLGGAWLAGLAVMNLVAEAFRGLHDYRMAGVMGGAGSTLLMFAALLLVFLAQRQVGLTQVTVLGVLAIVACALWGLTAPHFRLIRLGPVTAVSARQLLAVSLPLLVTSLAIFVSTQADLWILGAFRGKDEVAMYGAAMRLVQLVTMPMLVMNAVLAPSISEQFSQGHRDRLERLLRGSAALIGLPALLALALIALAAGPVLGWVYGDYYRNGATALLLVSAGQVVNVLSGSAAVVLMMTGHQRAAMVISAACGVGLVAGGLLVVDRFGINGIAVVTGLMVAVHGLISSFWVRRATGIRTHCGLDSIADVAREIRRLLQDNLSAVRARF
jgi:O-antigen/teichoic acid export membrane protein